MRNIKHILASSALIIGALSAPATAKNSSSATLMDQLNADKRLGVVQKGMTQSRAMKEALANPEHQYTLIVPRDKAMNSIDKEKLAALLTLPEGQNVNAMYDMVVIPERVHLKDIPLGNTIQKKTVGGHTIELTRFGPKNSDVVANHINIHDTIVADNGYIYIVDTLPVDKANDYSRMAWVGSLF